MTPLQLQVVADFDLVTTAGRVLAFGLVSFVSSAIAAVLFRWYFRTEIPRGLAALVGVGVVAVYFNTEGLFPEGLFQQVIGGAGGAQFTPVAIVTNVLALTVAAATTPLGRRIGDTAVSDLFAVSGVKELDAELSRVVRAVGRVTPVELPSVDDIEDMENYDPVDPAVKERLAGKTLLFPRRTTVAELRDRLVTRLKDDYDVGYVDVELNEDGEVTYLALGTRAAGIGPTLAPNTAAVAIEADPANAASPGDIVQIWRSLPESGSEPERVATAELHATSDDVVTVALDEAEAAKLDADARYALVTLPAEPRADREFASLLRSADETMAVVTVAEGSALTGRRIGDLEPTVVGLRPAGGSIEALPRRSHELAPGDDLYAVARPEALRQLEADAAPNGDDASAGSRG